MSKIIMAAVLCMAVFILPAQSMEFGTRDEAVAMAKRVQQKFKEDSEIATFRAITERAPGFREHDLYAFVYDMNGNVVAHGANSALVGQNRAGLQDQNGKYLVSEFIKVAQESGGGWVDYCWPNPVSVEDMSGYIERLGTHYLVGVAVFRKNPPVQQALRVD